MALIKCPECENQISDKAAVCPRCGIKINSNGEKKSWLNQSDKEGRRYNRPIGCAATIAIYLVIVAVAIVGITVNKIAYDGTESSQIVSGEHEEFEIVDKSIRFERRTNNSTVYVTGKITNYREDRCYIEFEYIIQDAHGNIIEQNSAISEKSIQPGKNFNFQIEYYDERAIASTFEIINIIGH